MILKKLEELESLITVPDVNKEPEQSINAMKMLNLIVELRGLVKNLAIPDVSGSGYEGLDAVVCPKCGSTDIMMPDRGLHVKDKCLECGESF